MFTTIVLTTSSIRTLNIFHLKSTHYEDTYITFLSLREMLSNRNIDNQKKIVGELNNYQYTVDCTLKKEKKNYILGEDERSSGNIGNFMIRLYQCKINLTRDTKEYSENIFLTRYVKSLIDE